MEKYVVIKRIEDIDISKWSDFVLQHVNGTIFQTPMMYYSYEASKKFKPLVIIVLDQKAEIVGLQLSVTEKVIDNFLGFLSTRSIVHGGPLLKDNDPKVLDLILKEYDKNIRRKAIYSQYRNMWNWDVLKTVFEDNKFLYEEHLDILFDLTKGEEQLFKEMKRVRRKGINQGYNKGIVVREFDIQNSENLTKAYEILKEVYDRIKLPIQNEKFFKNTIKSVNEHIICLGLFVNNELVGLRIAFCFKNLVYDWYAGAKNDFLSYRPNDVLPWEMIKWGVNNGYSVFDFGGAGKPNVPYGVRDFKLKFGGSLVEYGRYEKVHMPMKMKIAKMGFKILQYIK